MFIPFDPEVPGLEICGYIQRGTIANKEDQEKHIDFKIQEGFHTRWPTAASSGPSIHHPGCLGLSLEPSGVSQDPATKGSTKGPTACCLPIGPANRATLKLHHHHHQHHQLKDVSLFHLLLCVGCVCV